MIRADHIMVDSDEGGFVLVVSTEAGTSTFDIHGIALEFYDEVVSRMRSYVAEADSARRAVASGMSRADYLDSPQPVTSRPVSVEDAVEAGYELDDPKAPGFHERMVD